jgi:dihydroxyacetone kinase
MMIMMNDIHKIIEFYLIFQIIDHLKLVAGDKVVAMIDNLGGTSIMEMNILCGETKAYLGTLQIYLLLVCLYCTFPMQLLD